MLIGYARVSTSQQNLDSQIEALKAAGCEKIYCDEMSGTKHNRPELNKLLQDIVRKGDTIVVTKIDRLARSIINLNKIVQEAKNKGVAIHFLSEDIKFDAHNENSSLQMLLFNMLAAFSQFERELIVERTSEGRERAKRQGKHLGRPARNKKDIRRALDLYDKRNSNGHSVNDIVKLTGIPRSTLYHEIRKRDSLLNNKKS